MVAAVLWGRECKTVFEATEIVFEGKEEMVLGLMKEISWVMTEHSWFHVLFLVVRLKA